MPVNRSIYWIENGSNARKFPFQSTSHQLIEQNILRHVF